MLTGHLVCQRDAQPPGSDCHLDKLHFRMREDFKITLLEAAAFTEENILELDLNFNLGLTVYYLYDWVSS